MSHIRKALVPFAVVILFTAASQANAQEPIRFARTPDISPDGKMVAFSYLGDIWTVEAIGGVARPVTMHEKHDFYPVFSPDGKKIAFSSNRHGSYDVFTVPTEGGKPSRLTFDSADDFVNAWTPDGKSILFTSNRGIAFPATAEMYVVPITGGRAKRITANEGRDGVFSPNGNMIAYVRGPGLWYRKFYRGSSNDDVWIGNIDGTNNQRLTSFDGQDNSPMWAPNGQAIYYVTDNGQPAGTPANIVRQEIQIGRDGALTVSSPPKLITSHKDESVRRARLSGNGQWIVYECGADLWIVSTKSGAARTLAIEVHADDKTNPERIVTYTSGISEFAVSQDDNSVALVVHGQIFGMFRGSSKVKRLTESAAYDHAPAFSPDARKLIFLSDRSGHEDIWLLEAGDTGKGPLVKANTVKLTQLTKTDDAEQGINFSPDGKRISFLRNGKLLTMKPDGSDVQTIVGDTRVIDYEWSPDAKWIAYARLDGSWSSEIYIIPATGATAKDPVRNVTRYALFNAGITWSENGKLAFLSERRSNAPSSMYVMSLQKQSVAGAAKTNDIDWEDIHLRVFQPTTTSAVEGAISPDGFSVAFRSQQNGDDLWIANVDGKELTRLTTGNMKPTQIVWSKTKNFVYFRDGSGNIRMVSAFAPAATTSGGTAKSSTSLVPFQAKMLVKREDEFMEMFEQSWRALHENFYDAKFHGADWNAIREKYRPLVKHVALREDFYDLISLMMGELNASHLGIQGPPSAPEQVTADLGLIFDEKYDGPGLRVAEIIKRGPNDKRGIGVKAGDIIISIDGMALTAGIDPAKALNDKVGENVVCEVKSFPEATFVRKVELLAASRAPIKTLMYDRWVAANAKKVSDLSGGKLGYIHIPTMDEQGLDRFIRSLYSDNFDKEAIVLDVRFNGGGYTHDKVLNYLGGKEHTFFIQRDGGIGPVLTSTDRKFSKPLVLLINNRSYSDAEIFPHAFRTLGLGKLVGQPTGGFVIGTSSYRLIDGSLFRLPRTGVYTVKGINMEKEGVVPDYMVEPHPDQMAKGMDVQLEKAVTVLTQEVAAWKKREAQHPGRPGTISQPGPGIVPQPAPAAGTTGMKKG